MCIRDSPTTMPMEIERIGDQCVYAVKAVCLFIVCLINPAMFVSVNSICNKSFYCLPTSSEGLFGHTVNICSVYNICSCWLVSTGRLGLLQLFDHFQLIVDRYK